MFLAILRYWYFLVIGILVAVVFFLRQSNEKISAEKEVFKKDKEIYSSQVKVTIDKLGQQHAKVEALETETRQLKALAGAKDQYINKITKDFNIKEKNLRAAVSHNTTVQTDIAVVLKDSVTSDSVVVTQFDYIDEWCRVKGIINDDTVIMHPSFRIEQDIAAYYQRVPKRYWLDFFPPKQLYVEVINRNPYASTERLKTIINKPRKKFLGIF